MFDQGKMANQWFNEGKRERARKTGELGDVFRIESLPLEKWVLSISNDPRKTYSTPVRISELGEIGQTLFNTLKKEHDISLPNVIPISYEYLSANCPKCFSRITGEILLTIESYKKMAGFITNDNGVTRILNGVCPTCQSTNYLILWHGLI